MNSVTVSQIVDFLMSPSDGGDIDMDVCKMKNKKAKEMKIPLLFVLFATSEQSLDQLQSFVKHKTEFNDTIFYGLAVQKNTGDCHGKNEPLFFVGPIDSQNPKDSWLYLYKPGTSQVELKIFLAKFISQGTSSQSSPIYAYLLSGVYHSFVKEVGDSLIASVNWDEPIYGIFGNDTVRHVTINKSGELTGGSVPSTPVVTSGGGDDGGKSNGNGSSSKKKLPTWAWILIGGGILTVLIVVIILIIHFSKK